MLKSGVDTLVSMSKIAMFANYPMVFGLAYHTSNYKHHGVNFRQRSLIPLKGVRQWPDGSS